MVVFYIMDLLMALSTDTQKISKSFSFETLVSQVMNLLDTCHSTSFTSSLRTNQNSSPKFLPLRRKKIVVIVKLPGRLIYVHILNEGTLVTFQTTVLRRQVLFAPLTRKKSIHASLLPLRSGFSN